MNTNKSDGELVDGWKVGDSRAGEVLFERYYDSVARFFFNKADEASAQDLLQRTFLACIEGLPRLQSSDSFRSYLFGVAYRLLCKHYERQARERGRLEASDLSVEDLTARTPTQVFAEREEQRLLLRALRAIPLDYQVLLELVYWEKMLLTDVVEAMQIPLGTVKTRLRRGRQLLEQAMSTLSESSDLKRSTLDNLDRWAAEIGARRPVKGHSVALNSR